MKVDIRNEMITVGNDGTIRLTRECVHALRLDSEDQWNAQWEPTSNVIVLKRISASSKKCEKERKDSVGWKDLGNGCYYLGG